LPETTLQCHGSHSHVFLVWVSLILYLSDLHLAAPSTADEVGDRRSWRKTTYSFARPQLSLKSRRRRQTLLPFALKRGVDWQVVAAFCIGCSAASCQLPTSTELHVSVSNYDQVPAVRLELTEGPVSITVNCGETREWRFTSPTLLGPWHVRAKTADGHALGTRELDKRSQVILVEGGGFRVYPTIPSGMHGGVCRH
jgi:hypothetical protein